MNKASTRHRRLAPEELRRVADVLRLLAHPHRLAIIELLQQESKAPVRRVARWVGLSPAAASQHLNQLRRVGLLAAERRGREVWYRVEDMRCTAILECIAGGAKKERP